MRHQRKRRPKASKANQLLAPNQHSYQAHFKQNQKSKIAPDSVSNESGKKAGKLREIEQYLSLSKQAIAEETQRFLIHRNANIQLFLVICVTIAFFAYYIFSLYELWSKGDARWILGDVPAGSCFWKMVNHFVFRK